MLASESSPVSWQAAFVAVTYALGGTLDDARGALAAADYDEAASVTARLAHPERRVRARALALVLTAVRLELASARLS